MLPDRREHSHDRADGRPTRSARPRRVREDREHDAARLLGAHPAARHGRQPRRHQLRPRVQGQPRLPGHLRAASASSTSPIRRTRPSSNYTGCRHTSGQGDVVVHGNILVRSWDSPNTTGANANSTCMGEPVGAGLRGHPHLRHLRPGRTRSTSASCGWRRPATTPAPRLGCGSHTATGVPDDARGNLYIYNGGSSGTCTGIDIVRIRLANPTDAVFLSRAERPNRQCHDNNVLISGGRTLRDVRRRQRPLHVQVRPTPASMPARPRAASRTRRCCGRRSRRSAPARLTPARSPTTARS